MRNKYGNRKTTIDGIEFDSKAEGLRWLDLCLLQKNGNICKLERQVRIPLHGKGGPLKSAAGRQLHYVADFKYIDWDKDGLTIIEDKKGFETPEFKLKRSILSSMGIELLIT